MQVFRLMGMPDSIIAFDELPERLTNGFEMCRADGFPRHWKEWMGKRKKFTAIPPEKDLLTGQVRKFDPIVEEDAFFFLVDWTLNTNEEKWAEISDYVRQNVDKEVRLKEKIEQMAVPLAPNKTDGVTIEPEDVPIIPLQKGAEAIQDKPKLDSVPIDTVKCPEKDCTYEAQGKYAKNAIRMHTQKKHKKEPASV